MMIDAAAACRGQGRPGPPHCHRPFAVHAARPARFLCRSSASRRASSPCTRSSGATSISKISGEERAFFLSPMESAAAKGLRFSNHNDFSVDARRADAHGVEGGDRTSR